MTKELYTLSKISKTCAQNERGEFCAQTKMKREQSTRRRLTVKDVQSAMLPRSNTFSDEKRLHAIEGLLVYAHAYGQSEHL